MVVLNDGGIDGDSFYLLATATAADPLFSPRASGSLEKVPGGKSRDTLPGGPGWGGKHSEVPFALLDVTVCIPPSPDAQMHLHTPLCTPCSASFWAPLALVASFCGMLRRLGPAGLRQTFAHRLKRG